MRGKWPMIWLALAALCGSILFHTSQKVSSGREKVAQLESATAHEADSIRVLSAEWSYLNAPERLERLARAHLDLAPMRGKQFVLSPSLDSIQPAAGLQEKEKPLAVVAQSDGDDDDDDVAVASVQEETSPKQDVGQKKTDQKSADRKEIKKKDVLRTKTLAVKKQKQKDNAGSNRPSPRRDYVYSPSKRGYAVPSYVPPSAALASRDRGFNDMIKGLGVR